MLSADCTIRSPVLYSVIVVVLYDADSRYVVTAGLLSSEKYANFI